MGLAVAPAGHEAVALGACAGGQTPGAGCTVVNWVRAGLRLWTVSICGVAACDCTAVGMLVINTVFIDCEHDVEAGSCCNC